MKKKHVLVMRQAHFEQLRKELHEVQGEEAAAYLRLRRSEISSDPWTQAPVTKYLVRDVIPVSNEEIVSRSALHITWKTDSFVDQVRVTAQADETLGLVHSHPAGFTQFSQQDDENESDLSQTAMNRNGAGCELVSLILLPDGRLKGRVWTSPNTCLPLDLIIVTGDRLRLFFEGEAEDVSLDYLDRQALALGDHFNRNLRQLRIGVVGCGGTGSATAALLARLGVRWLALFDADVVEDTNLNRLHFSRREDVTQGRLKVDVVGNSIVALDLGTEVVKVPHWVSDPRAHNVLKSCDVVFGCTDDHSGRMLLNRLAYFYLLPLIDMGLAIDVGTKEEQRMQAFDGRVSVIQPGAPCLICAGVVDPVLASQEALKREDPAEFARRKEEAYVQGEGDPSPAVVPFTTSVAAMAVEELIHRIQGFRTGALPANHRLRKFHLMTDRIQGHIPRHFCPICASSEMWGKGDMVPFLDAC
jgi:molybdopterin/thiamine biosynthesis adenylyltransferase